MSKKFQVVLLMGTIVLGGLLWMTLKELFTTAEDSGRRHSHPEFADASRGASGQVTDSVRTDRERNSKSERTTDGKMVPVGIVGVQPNEIGSDALLTVAGRSSVTENSTGTGRRPSDARTTHSGMLSGPAAARAFLGISPERIEQQYRDYFVSAGLDDDSAHKIRDVVVGYRQAVLDTNPLGDAERSRAITNIYPEYQSKLRDVLGPERMAEFNAYSASVAFKPIAEATARQCAASGIEMTNSDVQALALALSKVENPLALLMPGLIRNEEKYQQMQQRTLNAAQSVLSQNQLEVFKQTVAAQTRLR